MAGIVTINIAAATFSVIQNETISTDCADIYSFSVYATNGDDIDITVTSNAINERYISNGITTTFSNTANLTYDTSLTITFAIENSSSPGIFNSATLTVENNDTVESIDFTVSRLNDNLRCECCDETFTLEILDEGVSLSTSPLSIDFVGDGVEATDDGSGNITVTITAGSSYTDEDAMDAIAAAFAAGSTTRISIGYVDGSNLFNFTVDDDLSNYDNSITQFISVGDNISDLTNDSGYITGYTVTEGDVTAHEAALSITESQISDLGSYLENIEEDTTPTLGGDLDADNNSIINIDNIEIEGHAYSQEIDNGNSSTADTINWTAGNFQRSTLTDNCTYTFTAPTGTTTLILKLIQDGTGSRVATFPASVKWSGGTAPTLTTTADAIDIISFYYDGTNYYGGSILDLQ